jgi:23S rRNA pseudouridine2605 synthase
LATTGKGTVSLERALSKLGFASRSEARELIAAGRVTIDGTIITEPARRVTPETVTIAIDGRAPARATEPIVVALHKPRGYVTTRSDPEGRKTVYDLLTDLPTRVVPVGRLDLATSGLLILTNDTQLANWLTDPHTALPRVYLVTVEGRIDEQAIERLTQGIVLDDERLAAAAVELRKASGKESHLTLTLTEGKNREVRRLLEAIGHPVTRLRRVRFGGLELGDLAAGHWRKVPAAEVWAAFPGYRSANSRPSARRRGLAQDAPRKRVPNPK